jgi:hypothetical protein
MATLLAPPFQRRGTGDVCTTPNREKVQGQIAASSQVDWRSSGDPKQFRFLKM